MTFYYDTDERALIENRPEFVEFDDDDRMIMNIDEMRGEEGFDKLRSMFFAVEEAIDDIGHDVGASITWVPEEDR